MGGFSERELDCWLTATIALVVLAGLLLASVGVEIAFAHDSWISRGGFRNPAGEWCCGDNDCAHIPSEQVEVHVDGYHVTLKAPDHSIYARETVPFSESQPSPDGAYWRCHRADGTRRCFFAPPPST